MSVVFQGSTIAANGNAQNVAVPCMCEALDIYSAAHSFTFQYVDPTNNNAPVGAAIIAEQLSATDFKLRIDGPKFAPWAQNQVIGILIGTNGDTIYLNPRRPS
jgi:hypothetical protein